MASTNGKVWKTVIGVVVAIPLAVLLMNLSERRRATPVTHGVYRAWYATTPAPVLVVEGTSYEAGYSDPERLNRSRDAQTTIQYHSYRLADGAHLGSFSREGWTVPTAGVWKDRVWVCGGGEPALLAAEGLKLVADRAAIRAAIADDVGGDFEIGGGKCYVDAYTGRLAVKGADGKRHQVGTDLRVEPQTTDAVHPPGYHCSVGASDLIEPRIAECLAPEAGPANLLVLSKASTLAKDADAPELLSGVSASPAGGTRVLWTKPLTEATGRPAAFWLGSRVLAPGRVAVLVGTPERQVHVVELNPADGAVESWRVLETAPPGG